MNPDIPALPDAEAGTNTPPFLTVTELAQRLKATVESQFDFVRIRAEISRPTRAASGHLYFYPKGRPQYPRRCLLENRCRLARRAAGRRA